MQRLKSIELKGYKSIKSASLELRPLNIFIGANGSGKSNLISFFKMMNHMMTANLQGFIGTSGGANSLLHYGAKATPQMEATLKFETENASDEYHMRLAHAAVDTLIFLDERISYKRHDFHGQPYIESLSAGHRETELVNQSRIADRTALASNKAYKSANVIRHMLSSCRVFQFHDTSDFSRFRQNCELDQNRNLMSDGGNLAAILYRMKHSEPDRYSQIEHTIRMIAPFFGSFQLAPLKLNPRFVQLRWMERDHEYDFGPHQISDGTLRAIALVTLMMQPAKDLPRVIIIDEPELGLHPYAISVLAAMLKSASLHSQIIVATESVTLLNHFAPDDIVVTERCMGETVFRRCEEKELSEWLSDYTMGQLWEKNVLGGRPSR